MKNLFLYLALFLAAAFCLSCCLRATYHNPSYQRVDEPVTTTSTLSGVIHFDPKFSGIEKNAIIRGYEMWSKPSKIKDKIKFVFNDNAVTWPDHFVRNALSNVRKVYNYSDRDSDPYFTHFYDNVNYGKNTWLLSKNCDRNVYVARALSTDKVIISDEQQTKATLLGSADSNCNRKIIYLIVDRLTTDSLFTSVAAHEFGHIFNLTHEFDFSADSIMLPAAPPVLPPHLAKFQKHSKCVSKHDIKLFCDTWVCEENPIADLSFEVGLSIKPKSVDSNGCD